MKRTREERLALAARKKKVFRAKQAYKKSGGAQRGTNGITTLALARPPRSITPSYGGPFGQVFETELCYADYFSLDPSVGGNTSNLFLANGCYDPNVALGGHQPHGYDALASIYENWQVLSSTIEATLFPQLTPTLLVSGTGTVQSQLVGSVLSIAVRDTSESLTGVTGSVTDILERPNIVTKFINSNSRPTTVRTSFSMPKFYGNSRDLQDTQITGAALSDPVDKVYYHVIFGPNNATYNLDSHQVVVRLKYRVRFFNPKNMLQS